VDLSGALAVLRQGGVVAYPTETYYGLGVDALDERALERLMQLKGRGADKALSVIVSGPAMLAGLCSEVPALAQRLMADHWPGPLTLVLPARPALPGPLVADGGVAVRQSPHPLAAALVAALGRPITATSANPAGQPAARTPAEVRAGFPAAVAAGQLFVCEGGETVGGPPSTLVRVRDGQLEVLRRGAVVI
jgi:L-threonylcarbamoyladenylate synthase